MKHLIAAVLVAVCAGVAWGQQANLILNPDFDDGTDHWTPQSGAMIAWNAAVDVDGDPDSGSIVITQVQDDPDAAIVRSDCFEVLGGLNYAYGGWFYIEGTQPGTPHVLLSLSLFDGPNCTGSALAGPSTNNIAVVDQWFEKWDQRDLDIAARSAYFRVNVFNSSLDDFTVTGDAMYAFVPDLIFADNFETGDTGRWTVTEP